MRLITFTFATVFLLSVFTSVAFSQEKNTDLCEVFAVNVKSEKETKIGSFTVDVSEGSSLKKAFKLPNTNLYLISSIYYDDDLESQKTGGLGDAIHLGLAISYKKTPKEKDSFNKTVIAYAETHFLYDGEIYPVDLTLMANTPFGKKFFYITCKQNTRIN